VPHSVYRDLELPPGKTVVDVWSYWLKRANTRPAKAKAAGRKSHYEDSVTGLPVSFGYLIDELLEAGHEVVGLDNFSKYGL